MEPVENHTGEPGQRPQPTPAVSQNNRELTPAESAPLEQSQPIADLSQVKELDGIIDSWVAARLNALYDNAEQGKIVYKQLGEIDSDFTDALKRQIGETPSPGVLSVLLNYASERASSLQAEMQLRRSTHGAEARVLIHDTINGLWTAVGAERTRQLPGDDAQKRAEEIFANQLPLHCEALVQHIYEVALIPGEINREELTNRVTSALERIRDRAQQIGEKRYLEADLAAAELQAALPGKSTDPGKMFEVLSSLSQEQQKVTLEAFQERYGKEFITAVRDAYKSPLVQIKNFFKIPALKAALEEKFGIGVGLLSVRKVLLPNFKSWRGYFQGKNWKEYATRVVEFVKDLGHKANTPELDRLESLLDGNRIATATHSMFIAVWEGKSRDEVADALLGLSEQERLRVEKEFMSKYARLLHVDTLQEAITQQFDEGDAAYIEARLAGQDDRAHALLLREILNGSITGKIQLLISLSQMKPDQIERLRVAYESEFDTRLNREHLAAYFPQPLGTRFRNLFRSQKVTENPLLDWAENLLAGKVFDASAARLRCALEGRSGEWPGIVFYHHAHAECDGIIRAFNRLYQTEFWSEFEKKRGKERTKIMRSLTENGEITLAQQIRHTIIGFGADADGMRAGLSDLTPEQQEELGVQYGQEFTRRVWNNPLRLCRAAVLGALDIIRGKKHENGHREKFLERISVPRDLDTDLRDEFCGHNLFDAMNLRKGVQTDPQTMMGDLLARYQHEMAGKQFIPPESRTTPFKEKLQGWARRRIEAMLEAEKSIEIEDKGWRNILWRKARNSYRLSLEVLQLALARENPDEACLKRDMDRIHTFFKEHVEEKPDLSVHVRRTFGQLHKIAHQSLDLRREAQRKKAEAVANLGSLVTATAAWTGFAFLHLPYAPLAFTVFSASLAGRFGVKTLLKGDGYGERELLRDSFLAAVDGATLSLGKYVKSLRVLRFLGFGRTALSTAMKFGMKKSLYHFGNTSLTSALLDSKESGHARQQMEIKRAKFLDEYEQIIHHEMKRITSQHTWVDQASDLRPVFRRIGRELSGG